MQTLVEKVINLKLQAALAARQSAFWQKAIVEYGERKATDFYRHLGLNHVEAKSFEWEGLTLSREPKEHEKIAVKGIAQAQESAKESIGKILLTLREALIVDGLKGIKKLDPANYHELILQPSSESRSDLRDRLVKVHRQGRMLVARELERQQGKAWLAEGSWQHPVDFDSVHDRNGFGPHDAGCIGYDCKCKIEHQSDCKLTTKHRTCSCEYKAAEEDEFDALDMLTDLTGGRVANDVQSRIIAAAQRFSLLGTTGNSLITAVQTEIQAGSVSYIDRASQGLANRVISIGRGDEAERRSDEWDKITYSALLDLNTCGPCADADGEESDDGSDLEPVPNISCAGGDYCRCFWVYINQ